MLCDPAVGIRCITANRLSQPAQHPRRSEEGFDLAPGELWFLQYSHFTFSTELVRPGFLPAFMVSSDTMYLLESISNL